MECHELDPELHDVMSRIMQVGATKKGLAKTTVNALATDLDLPRREILARLDDLVDAGFVEVEPSDHLRVVRSCSHGGVLTTMVDTPQGAALSRAHTPARTPPRALGLGIAPAPRLRQEAYTIPRPRSASANFENPEAGRIQGPRGQRSKSAPEPHEMTTGQLTQHLRRELEMERRRRNLVWTGGFNAKAVGANIKAMREHGLGPEVIHAMIHLFTATEGWQRPGVPAWRSFVQNREALLAEIQRIQADQAMVELSDEAWLQSPEPGPTDLNRDWLT